MHSKHSVVCVMFQKILLFLTMYMGVYVAGGTVRTILIFNTDSMPLNEDDYILHKASISLVGCKYIHKEPTLLIGYLKTKLLISEALVTLRALGLHVFVPLLD